MRLRRLDLTRYGRFTDFAIDFGERDPAQPDFHIVYGPNEAGKSTAFSGYLDLLFGIPTQSDYGFLHPYSAMQLGAALEWDGEAYEFLRIKRPKNSLLGAGGQPVAETAIAAALNGIGRDSYRAMFSLDDDTLEKGGDTILRSQGDLGQLLFSASAGLSELSQTLAGLQAEADTFYKFRARSGALSELKAKLGELKERREGIDTLATHYAQLAADKAQSETQYAEARDARAASRTRLDSIRRLLDALPRLARLDALRAELDALGTLPEPPPGWAGELPELAREELTLKVREETSNATLERLSGEIAQLAPDEAALQSVEAFRRLGDGAARTITAAEDLPNRRRALAETQARIGTILLQLDRASADPQDLILSAPATERLRELIEKGNTLILKREAAEKERLDAAARLVEAEEVLRRAGGAGDSLGADWARVRQALADWRKSEHAARLRSARKAESHAGAVLAERMAALGPWTGDADALLALPAPAPATVEGWKARGRDTEAKLARHRADAEREETDRQRLQAEQAVDARSGMVSESEANETRAARDAAWAAHRTAMDPATARAFEAALEKHDTLAARLLAQSAERVRMLEVARALGVSEAAIARSQSLAAEAEAALGALAEEMREALPALPPAWPFPEREAWLARRLAALDAAAAFRAAERDRAEAERDGVEAETRLRGALLAAGMSISTDAPAETLVAEAERLAAQGSELRALQLDTEARRRDVEARTARQTGADAEKAAWEAEWAEACRATWLGAGATVGTVRGVLAALDRLAPALAERDGLADRIAKMETDQESFARNVGRIAEVLEPVAGETADAMALYEAVGARVRGAENAADARARKERERELAVAEARKLGEAIQLHERRASAMLRFFAVGSLHEVATKLRDAERRAGLITERDTLERTLLAGMGETDLGACEATLREADASALAEELADTESRFEAEDARVSELFAARAKAADKIEAIGGDDAVARIEEERRTVLLAIEDGALHHLRLRVGIAAAEGALRAYRDRHRSSMMERASNAFQTISRGAYSRLGTQPEKDAEVLVGITADGASKLAKDMSKGTRFQLYLALRAAGYFEFAETREPVPFVADDIMETFDDFRAEETFRLFAEMAGVGQVIYLTHHRHLCAIAREVCPSVKVHELPVSVPGPGR